MKIWFNRWFTTVAHCIDRIRANEDQRKFIIYGSHPNKDALYLQHCDAAFLEPDVSGEQYLDFCLDFCRKHSIDIFIPRKENVLISKKLHLFEEIGVKVLVCPDSDLMEMVNNKAAAYRSLSDIFSIPDFYVVNNEADFKKAYEKLKRKGHRVCFKPVIGEGAKGFRVIEDEIETVGQLFNEGSSNRISLKYVCDIFSQQETFLDLMVLEYLEGPEYSIDCVASSGKLYAAIPRRKSEGRVREIVEHKELINLANQFHERFNIPYIFNIQVKYNHGVPKLLEINPRISGGVHFSCLSGLNLPYLAIKLLLGEKVEIGSVKFGIRASHLEKEMLLDSREIRQEKA
jgi:biotin carboxylase